MKHDHVNSFACRHREKNAVAAAKVGIPATASTVLARERLHLLLDAAVEGTDVGPSVTVVCAPAGAGKTTMLATWARQRIHRSGAHVAWMSLDTEDNDTVLLWTAILRALSHAGAWSVDDAVRTVNFLLRHAPVTMPVVLATRFPPPLIIPRLRLKGRLREIGGAPRHPVRRPPPRPRGAHRGIVDDGTTRSPATVPRRGPVRPRAAGWRHRPVRPARRLRDQGSRDAAHIGARPDGREQALLTELPSMRTAEEIAHTMFVSVNTVKTHLRGIYRKLGVSHRRDAITVARQRGLL